jgi:autotransporter adhesin
MVDTQGATFNNTTMSRVDSTGMTYANGVDSTATGLGAEAGGVETPANGASAYGAYANAADANTTAVGFRSVARFAGSVAIGFQAQAIADPTVAIGANALASGDNAVAVGAGATATATNSVAIGANSVADQPNTVSVGSAGAERRLTNVAPGIQPTDAVNLAQLRDVARIAYSGVATSLALSGAVMPDLGPGEKGVGIGIGTYRGYSAVALRLKGVSSSGESAWGVGVSTTGREWGVQLGFGFKWK